MGFPKLNFTLLRRLTEVPTEKSRLYERLEGMAPTINPDTQEKIMRTLSGDYSTHDPDSRKYQ